MNSPAQTLAGAFASFVPVDRQFDLAYGEPLPKRENGAALVGDLSGFTQLVAELRAVYGGKRAAEEITEYLNAVFAPIIEIVHHFGGSVIGFAGDAIRCWFGQDEGQRAVGAAFAMKQAVSQVPPIQLAAGGQRRIAIKIAVVAGQAGRYLVGDPAIRRIEALAGPLVDRLDATLQVAAQGEIVAGEEVVAALGDALVGGAARVTEDGARCFVCDQLPGEPQVKPWPPLPPIQALRFRPWVPRSIADRLETGGDALLAEVRPVVAMFLQLADPLGDLEYDHGEVLDDYVHFVQRTVTALEGDLIELTIGDKGNSFYIVFGATVAHEEDAHRAVRAAIALRQPPATIELGRAPRIGISSGEMRVGTYGSPIRREFGVQGQEVNIAARLMSQAAPGEILISRRVADAIARRVQTEAAGALVLKGIDKPVQAFRVMHERDSLLADLHGRGSVPLVGRSRELDTLAQALEQVADGSSRMALIDGAAGIGKSRILAELVAIAERRGVVTWFGAAEEIDRRRIGHIWSHLGLAAFGIAPGERGESVRAKIARHLPEGHDTDSRLPLLNPLYAMQLPETALTESLTGKIRADRTTELLLTALEHARGSRPLLIVLEDAHWMDVLSLSVVAAACDRLKGTLIALSTREFTGASELAAIVRKRAGTQVRLAALDRDGTRALVAWRLGVEDLPDDLAAHIFHASGGQPFFAEELAYALQEAGLIKVGNGQCHIAASRRLDEVEFPSTLQGIITSRLDKLAPSQQLVLKVGSVIGRSFAFNTLAKVYPGHSEPSLLRTDLDALSRQGITSVDRPEPDLSYMFRHALLRDVVYRRLLTSQRRDLHRAVCAWYEREHADNLKPFYTVLAHHWQGVASSADRARDPQAYTKAIDYLRKSGGEASRNGMLRDAVVFGLDALRLMGVELPIEPLAMNAQIDAGEEQVIKALAGRQPSALLDLKPMSDPEPARIVETLLEIMPAAFMAQMVDVFALAAISNLKLTIAHGNAPATPIAYSMYAIVRRTRFKDIKGAEAFSRLALALDQRQGGQCFGVCAYIHTRFVSLWCDPLHELSQLNVRGAQASLAARDVLFGCFNLSLSVQYAAATGVELSVLKKIAREQRDFVDRRVRSSTFHCVLELQYAKALAGETEHRYSLSDDEHDEQADIASICDTDLYNQMVYYHVTRLKLFTYYRSHNEAVMAADSAFALLSSSAGQVAEMELRFYFAVAAMGAWSTADRQRRTALRARAEEQGRIIRGWRMHCEANFGHLANIVDGRLACLDDRDELAVRLFEEAASLAIKHKFLQHAALAYELLAQQHLKCKRPELARNAFDAAANTYQRWGAHLKVQDVRAQRP